jgi:hypothetical protein
MDREVRRGAMDDGEEDVAGEWELLLRAMDMEQGGQGEEPELAGAGGHGCWPSRGFDHGDSRRPWSRRGAREGMSWAPAGRCDALEERRCHGRKGAELPALGKKALLRVGEEAAAV